MGADKIRRVWSNRSNRAKTPAMMFACRASRRLFCASATLSSYRRFSSAASDAWFRSLLCFSSAWSRSLLCVSSRCDSHVSIAFLATQAAAPTMITAEPRSLTTSPHISVVSRVLGALAHQQQDRSRRCVDGVLRPVGRNCLWRRPSAVRLAEAVPERRDDHERFFQERLQRWLVSEDGLEQWVRRILRIVGPAVAVADDLKHALERAAALRQAVAVVALPVVGEPVQELRVCRHELGPLQQRQRRFDGECVRDLRTPNDDLWVGRQVADLLLPAVPIGLYRVRPDVAGDRIG